MKDQKDHDPVNNPSHYTDGKIEVIDFIEDKNLGFHLGNAVKYIARAGKKDPEKTNEDLLKAIWYINRHMINSQRISEVPKESNKTYPIYEKLEGILKGVKPEYIPCDEIDNIDWIRKILVVHNRRFGTKWRVVPDGKLFWKFIPDSPQEQLAKVGDMIEWSFGLYAADHFRNKTFNAEVAFVNEEEQTYGVYASYGQDYIPFDSARVINQ